MRLLLQRLYLVFVLVDTSLSGHVPVYLLWFPHCCALPLPDSSRTVIISIDCTVVERAASSTPFPGTVLGHLGLLVRLPAGGACLMMLAMMRLKAMAEIHVARVFRA